MVYVGTSAVVALIVNEAASAAVAAWYAGTKRELVTASWCVTEFASALLGYCSHVPVVSRARGQNCLEA